MFKYVTFCEILVSNEMDSKYIQMYVLYRCILEVFGVRVKHVTEKKKQNCMVFMFKYVCPIISNFGSGTETHCVHWRLYDVSHLVKLSWWVPASTSLDCHLKNKLGIIVMILKNLYYACFTLFGFEKVESALLVDKRL